MSELAEKLNCLPFFSDLESQELDAIAQTAKSLEFNAGETVFWEGDACAGIYIVETGWLKAIKISFHGREQVIRFLRPGEMFNEVAFFSNKSNITASLRIGLGIGIRNPVTIRCPPIVAI